MRFITHVLCVQTQTKPSVEVHAESNYDITIPNPDFRTHPIDDISLRSKTRRRRRHQSRGQTRSRAPKIMNFFNPLNPIVIFVRLPGLIWLTEISIPKRSISRFSLVRRSVFEMRLRGWDSSSFKPFVASRRLSSGT